MSSPARPLPRDMPEYLSCDPLTGVMIWKKRVNSTVAAGSLVCQHQKSTSRIGAPLYATVQFQRKRYLYHRVVWFLCTGEDPGVLQIDHINHDGRDNRLANLRLATISQNNANSRQRRRALPRGVYAEPDGFRAAITVGRQTLHLGHFGTADAAEQAWMEARLRHFGAFAPASYFEVAA